MPELAPMGVGSELGLADQIEKAVAARFLNAGEPAQHDASNSVATAPTDLGCGVRDEVQYQREQAYE